MILKHAYALYGKDIIDQYNSGSHPSDTASSPVSSKIASSPMEDSTSEHMPFESAKEYAETNTAIKEASTFEPVEDLIA